jgi:uncharacterized protein YndB with AHSA1/START domain
MSVQRDASGNRWVQAEAEVPGTPEEVWRAIATGPGISSWFVPTEVEERSGGAVTSNFGPGMGSVSEITEWDPPRRFAADSRDDMGPDDPTVATEWIVEARDGGTCTVRVVHRWFTEKDDWDEQFTGTVYGWLAFFRILRLYLTHFRDQPGAVAQIMGVAAGETREAAWAKLTGSLGIDGAAVGRRVETKHGAPRIAGVVEWWHEPASPVEPEELLIRLDEPAPGLAHLVTHDLGGQMHIWIRMYVYGQSAPAIVACEEPAWQVWLNERFAPVGGAADAAA